MRQQTLLTGFGAFGRVVRNPTERLVDYFARQDVPEHDLVCMTLPVSFANAAAQMKALLEIGGCDGRPFENVLMLGVATGSTAWRVERFGRNRDQALTDAEGFTPPEREIVPDGPAVLPATFPLAPQVLALETLGLPVVVSDSAGGYLCNHLLYSTLHLLHGTEPPVRTGFLHIPADEETFAPGLTSAPVFSFTQHIDAVQAILAVLLSKNRIDRMNRIFQDSQDVFLTTENTGEATETMRPLLSFLSCPS